MDTKVCNGCGVVKTSDQFSKRTRSSDGLSNKCKVCKNASTSAWRSKNAEREAEYRKKYYAENRSLILQKRNYTYTADPEKFRAARRESYANNREKSIALAKAWQADNPERVAAASAAYRAKNIDAIRERQRQWLLANPEKMKAAKDSWNGRNIKRIREYARQYHDDNKPERNAASKAWREKNPEAKRAHYHKRRARMKGAEGHYTADDIKAIYIRQRMRCPYCKASIKDEYHIDHIIPLARGGSNWPHNIQLTCRTCNIKKHANDPIDFANRMGMLL